MKFLTDFSLAFLCFLALVNFLNEHPTGKYKEHAERIEYENNINSGNYTALHAGNL